jgi:Mn-dependent DtxR family transcriptional regulator
MLLSCLNNDVRCMRLKVELLKVLKVMGEVTHRMDLAEFAGLVDLSTDDVLQSIQDLAKTGYLKKSGGGYGITGKGKAVLKAQLPVAEGLEFRFYVSVGQPTDAVAKSLIEFYEAMKAVDVASLEFHVYRGDFANWARDVIKDETMAEDFEDARQQELKGEGLRKRITWVIEKHYDSAALR